MSARNIIVVFPLAIWLLAEASGCGGGGPTRYELSGKVTFEGKSIPHGRIVFEPDASKKNAGPQGFANIKDGQFDTSDGGQGHIGGAHLIRVEGFDAVPGAGAPPKPLFNAYQSSADLPQEKSTKDIDVPKSAAKDLQISTGPPP